MPIQVVDLKKACSATQQMILPANPGRTYALLINDGAADIYLGMGIPAVVNRGIRLNNGGGSFEINLTNPWQGEIYAVGDATNPTLLITEY